MVEATQPPQTSQESQVNYPKILEIITTLFARKSAQEKLKAAGWPPADIARLPQWCAHEKTVCWGPTNVIEAQVEEMKKTKKYFADKTPGIADTVESTMKGVSDFTCNVCGFPGHSTSSCWIKQQLAATCRSKGRAYTEAYDHWTSALAFQQKISHEAVKAAVKAQTVQANATVKLLQKTLRADPTGSKLKDRIKGVKTVVKENLASETVRINTLLYPKNT